MTRAYIDGNYISNASYHWGLDNGLVGKAKVDYRALRDTLHAMGVTEAKVYLASSEPGRLIAFSRFLAGVGFGTEIIEAPHATTAINGAISTALVLNALEGSEGVVICTGSGDLYQAAHALAKSREVRVLAFPDSCASCYIDSGMADVETLLPLVYTSPR